MKTILVLTVLGAFLCGLGPRADAAISVIDIGLIRTNLFNAKRDLAQQILQGQRAFEQIQHLRSQIEQVDDYLERFGDPKSITVDTFQEVLGFLKEVEASLTTDELLEGLKGDEILRQGSLTQREVTPEIVVDGKVVARRDTQVFLPEVAARRSFEHFHEVHSSVLEKRRKLKSKLEASLLQLNRAATASEVQKLDIVVRNLEAQLAATDRELQFAASQATVRYLENLVESEVQGKARIQEEREKLRVATKRNVSLYQFPSKPVPFKR